MYRLSKNDTPLTGLTLSTASNKFLTSLDLGAENKTIKSRVWDFTAFEDGQIWAVTNHEKTAGTVANVWYSGDEGNSWQKMAEGTVASAPDFLNVSHGVNGISRSDGLVVSTNSSTYSYKFSKM